MLLYSKELSDKFMSRNNNAKNELLITNIYKKDNSVMIIYVCSLENMFQVLCTANNYL